MNPGTDTAAIDAFCGMVNKEPNSAHIATKLIITRVQSPQEWEALQSLNVLEACMKRCGSSFHTEVGKFRFLNEMIKLVSPKYLGGQTPKPVRDRVLQLMYSWTVEYPRESKIKEAYQMLRKQGVVSDDPPLDTAGSGPSHMGSGRSSVFEDEKKQRLLQKLLQSRNPDDLHAANRLIKTMVKEDERRTEIMSRRATELEAAHNNARLLSEMLDCYLPGSSSKEDLDLIKELHQSCERFSNQICKDLKPDESLFGEVMETVDELKLVFAKYQQVVLEHRPFQHSGLLSKNSPSGGASLLDLSAASGSASAITQELADLGLGISESSNSDLGGLGDLLALEETNVTPLPPLPVLQPVSLNPAPAPAPSLGNEKSSVDKPGAVKALEDLDALGETLLKQNLPAAGRTGSQFNKAPVKVPMNLLGRSSSSASESGAPDAGTVAAPRNMEYSQVTTAAALDLDFLVGTQGQTSNTSPPKEKGTLEGADELLNGDDAMVDLSDESTNLGASLSIQPSQMSQELPQAPMIKEAAATSNGAHVEEKSVEPANKISEVQTNSSKDAQQAKVTEVKPLNDISVSLNSIKPGPVPPLTALDERNGISVILHLARDTPRPDVSVYVVTTISKNSSPLSNYVFQAVVPKTCKLRLLPASSSELPAHNPFLPPSAITQVMLVANPSKVPVNLKFMVSYSMDDDTATEMGEVERLPMLSQD